MVVFDGHVTDISGRANQILRALIQTLLTDAQMVVLSDNHDATRPQTLSPNECVGLRVIFFVQSTVGEKGQPWHGTLLFVDLYGNRHKVAN
jgi:hypothetical protein